MRVIVNLLATGRTHELHVHETNTVYQLKVQIERECAIRRQEMRLMLTCLDRFKRIRKEFGKNLKESWCFKNISDFLKDFLGQ